jgi:hypothetical protein
VTGSDGRRNRSRSDNAAWNQFGGGNPDDQYKKAVAFEGAGGGWDKAFNDTAGSYLSQALPSLRNNLQLTREDSVRRGIGTGDLGTSNEGDLVSQWGQGISNTLGGLAMQGYENNRNRYLDLLTGGIDRRDSQANDRKNRSAGMWGSVLQAGGLAAGAFL